MNQGENSQLSQFQITQGQGPVPTNTYPKVSVGSNRSSRQQNSQRKSEKCNDQRGEDTDQSIEEFSSLKVVQKIRKDTEGDSSNTSQDDMVRMNQYKKESKANCLSMKYSNDVGLNQSLMVSSLPEQQLQQKHNKVVIDLNKLREQEKMYEQSITSQIQMVLDSNSVAKQKDLDDFKRQIQTDLKKITSVLEQSNLNQILNVRPDSKIQRSIQASLIDIEQVDSNANIKSKTFDTAQLQNEMQIGTENHLQLRNTQQVNNSDIVTQESQNENKFYSKQKINNEINQSFYQTQQAPKSHSGQKNPHARHMSHQNNKLCLNLQHLPKTKNSYYNSYHDKRKLTSNERKMIFKDIRSPLSNSSQYSLNRSMVTSPKTGIPQKQLYGRKRDLYLNGQPAQEENKFLPEKDYLENIKNENDDLKQQIHGLRSKNAEHRSEIIKLKNLNQQQLNQIQQLKESNILKEKQRKKVQDGDYILKQGSELEKLEQSRIQQQNLIQVQEEQMSNLKGILNQTLMVKLKYENIIKRLVENEHTRSTVVSVIEQIEHSRSTTALSQQSQTNLAQQQQHNKGLSLNISVPSPPPVNLSHLGRYSFVSALTDKQRFNELPLENCKPIQDRSESPMDDHIDLEQQQNFAASPYQLKEEDDEEEEMGQQTDGKPNRSRFEEDCEREEYHQEQVDTQNNESERK